MALPFPLIPVLIGAALGAAVTYILTTRNARKQITDTLQDLGDSVEAGAEKIKNAAADVAEETAETAKDVASKVVD